MNINGAVKAEVEDRYHSNPLFAARIQRTMIIVEDDIWLVSRRRLSEGERGIMRLAVGTALVLADIPAFMIK